MKYKNLIIHLTSIIIIIVLIFININNKGKLKNIKTDFNNKTNEIKNIKNQLNNKAKEFDELNKDYENAKGNLLKASNVIKIYDTSFINLYSKINAPINEYNKAYEDKFKKLKALLKVTLIKMIL